MRWEHAVERAGFTTDPATVAVWWAGAVAAAAILLGTVDVRLGTIGALGVGVAGLVFGVARTRRTRAALRAALPTFVRTVAAELRIGGTVTTALERVAAHPGPLAADCRSVVGRLHLGAPLVSALAWWADEYDDSDIRAVVGALSVATSVGGPAAAALDGLATSLADRIAVQAEARAHSAQARSSAFVVVSAPFGYLVFASIADRRAISVLVATPIGVTCLGVSTVLDLVALWWIRALLRSASGAPRVVR
jgi:tight adherence protein B